MIYFGIGHRCEQIRTGPSRGELRLKCITAAKRNSSGLDFMNNIFIKGIAGNQRQ